jgi:hypothetical protein
LALLAVGLAVAADRWAGDGRAAPPLAVPSPQGPGLPPAAACAAGGKAAGETFGTAVQFVRNPGEAGRLAGEGRKLLFLLHVSGNFEEARFT